MKLKLIIAVAAAVSLSACATVTKGSNDTVKMTSNPSEASVLFEDTAQKLQPQSVTLAPTGGTSFATDKKGKRIESLGNPIVSGAEEKMMEGEAPQS